MDLHYPYRVQRLVIYVAYLLPAVWGMLIKVRVKG
jgi:hypothetical protein